MARPKVVVFDPLTSVTTWSYEVERAILDEHGVDLVIPNSPAEADEAVRDADVAIVNALRGMKRENIEPLTNCVGLLCYSIGMNQVDHEAAAEKGIPVGNVAVLRRRGLGPRADAAARRRASPDPVGPDDRRGQLGLPRCPAQDDPSPQGPHARDHRRPDASAARSRARRRRSATASSATTRTSRR